MSRGASLEPANQEKIEMPVHAPNLTIVSEKRYVISKI
jgi:hypothetical protein